MQNFAKLNFFPIIITYGGLQGWRKTMEDSHIALTDISDSQLKSFLEEHAVKTSTDPAVSLFGVFDGHGGIS